MAPIFSKIQRLYNQPLVAWALAPLVPLLTGTILGAKSGAFQFYPFLLLFVYELFLFTMELVLRKQLEKPLEVPPFLKGSALAVGIFILILLAVATNWIISALLLLIALFYLLAYSPQFRMVGSPYYLVLQLFFQGIIVGFLAFYAQTRFLDISLLLYLLPNLFLTAAFVFIQEENVLTHTRIASMVGKSGDTYQSLIVEKESLLSLTFTIAALLTAFLLFLFTGTDGWKQLLFLIILLLAAAPLFSGSFRKGLNHLTFYPMVAALITALYAMLLDSPFHY